MMYYLLRKDLSMNLEQLTKNPAFRELSIEKQQLIITFAQTPMPQNVNELAAKFTKVIADARRQNIIFTHNESALLINVLMEQLSPGEKQRALSLLKLMNFK